MLPPGIQARQYEPAPGEGPRFRAELGIPPGAPVVGMIACLKPQKNPGEFVRIAGFVARRRPDAHFFIAGDGALRAERPPDATEDAMKRERVGFRKLESEELRQRQAPRTPRRRRTGLRQRRRAETAPARRRG